MKKIIRVCGIRRSGNHAIIKWLVSSSKKKYFHFNNQVVSPEFGPWISFKYGDGKSEEMIEEKNSLLNLRKRNYLGLNDKIEYSEFITISFEDTKLKLIEDFKDRWEDFLNQDIDATVILLRDPYNLFASRIKSNMISDEENIKYLIDLWKIFAREILNETNYMPGSYFINYNEWFMNSDYRSKILCDLGLNSEDAGINSVDSFGGGSSFDGIEYDGKA